jgi:hypothetical protein
VVKSEIRPNSVNLGEGARNQAESETFQFETFFLTGKVSYIASYLKTHTMSENIEFPKIPNDNHSQILLETLTKISDMIMKDGPEDEHVSKCAAFLRFLGTAPLLADYLYFKVHEETRDMCHHLSDHYNYYIHSQGDEYKLEVLNKEVKSFGPYFNHFQLALYYIDLKAKEDKDWAPLSDLIWAFYCSLYNYRKCEEFLESVYSCLEKLVED